MLIMFLRLKNSYNPENRTKKYCKGGVWQSGIMKTLFRKSSSIDGCLPLKVIFHQRSSSTEGRLLSKVVFHQRLSSIKGCLPSMVIFHQRSSFINGCMPKKIVFKDHLPSMVVFHQGCIPLKVLDQGPSGTRR